VVSVTLRMKTRAARTMPASTATVRSAKTVSSSVVEPDSDLEFGEAEDLWNLVPLAHVVADDHEDGGEDGERNEAGQRGSEEQDCEDGKRMHHSRNGSLRAGANIGGGARDGAGGGKAAEERGDDVGEPGRRVPAPGLWRSPDMRSATTALH